MKKNLLKTICIALTVALYVGSLYAQSFIEKTKGDGSTSKMENLSLQSFSSSQPVISHRGVISDDVEGHTAWTIDSPGSVPWSYYNGNPIGTWGITGVTFPNAYEPMAFIVFRPSGTIPSTVSTYPPHSGDQFFACFNTTTGTTNGWIISPTFSEVEATASISFWARSLTLQYGPERFKVLVSTTGGTAPGDFTTVLSPGSYVEAPLDWTEYTYNLPATTKCVAIQCCSFDAFALFLDDITINGVTTGEPVLCDPATNLAVSYTTDCKATLTWTAPSQPATYNVYRDGATIASAITETTYNDSGFDASKSHTWDIKVVCGSEESDPVSKTLEACVCNPITNGAVAFSGNTATLTWTPVEGATGYEVTREGTHNVTAPPYTEENDFEDGTEYAWTVVTVCTHGKSDPFEIKAIYVGIHEIGFETFSIIPNPAQNEISIKSNLDFQKVEIINFLGQTVISQSVGQNFVKLDISNLTCGVYFVRIASENGNSVKKFVKK